MNLSKKTMLASSMLAGFALVTGGAYAQEAAEEEIVVTGTRIQAPGVVSSSPIATVGAEEILLQQQSQVERILRVLPISVPGDGENVNNGTAGVATVNLRGLGAQRNLILVDGKRATPYNVDGQVDVSQIPTAMLERVDIVTGGASATYGSDAISGAVNFVLKRDFEGVEFGTKYGRTSDIDGKTYDANLALGANLGDDGNGNVALSLNYAKREGIQFGAREYGNVGVDSLSGSGLGVTGAAQPANCGGVNTVPTTFGGSGTTLPARIIMPSYDPDGAGPLATVSGNQQFRNDGTLGANCNQFNFNPYNYYQTPSERFGGIAYGHYAITENVEAYARALFSATNVRQQIAPSGIFNTPFNVPLANPFLSASARTTILNQFEGARRAGALTLTGANQNWFDNNANGVVDVADTVRFGIGRRTVEFGERSTTYDNNAFQMLVGLRGTFADSWNWDVNFSHGESDRTNISAGYTNVSNAATAVNTVSATECRTATGTVTAGCVPLNLFGSEGSITSAMAAYSSAVGIEQQNYKQTYGQASLSGPFDAIKSPFAAEAVQGAIGVEYREEIGITTPDECLKLAPASCLGGAGGNTLPISGGYSVREYFGELLVPLIADAPGFQNLALELGYRYSDYDPSGINRSWKAGVNWEVWDDLRIRVMAQRAARAPNVGELAAPQRSGLDNATIDPCSVANAAAITPTLRALCISTGMTATQVGTVPDIVAGQVNVFIGTDLNRLPETEEADTLTAGFVYQPSFLTFFNNPSITVDYYAIDIEGFIGTLAAEEVIDSCYEAGRAEFCSLIIRQAGNLVFPGSGIQTFTTNLVGAKAEGVDLGLTFGLDLVKVGLPESFGSMSFGYNATFASKLEFQSSSVTPVVDCLGYYGNACGPLTDGNPAPEYKHAARATWDVGNFQISSLWRRVGETEVIPRQRAATFSQFRQIEAYDYFDFTASYGLTDQIELIAAVTNAFDNDPPIVGGNISTTSSNGGNTFPQVYDSIGQVWSVGTRMRF